MKNRKFGFLLAVLLVAAMVLAGCGKDTNVSGKVEPTQKRMENLPSGTVQQSKETQATEPETQATEPEENPLSLGRMEGGVYTNTYVGYGCELDSTWTFYSAQELQELPASTKEAIEGTELGDALKDYEQITDMMAECVNDMTSINVLYQKLSMQERIAYALLSEEEILDAVLEQSEMMKEAYAQAGIEDASMEKVTVTFLGEPRAAIRTTAKIQGADYFILQIYDFNLGEYSVTTTFASFVEDKTESLLELFYKVE